MQEDGRLDGERAVLLAWGDVIRRYRSWKSLSRRDLSQRAGMSTVFLGEIERGEKDPSSHTLCLIASALDVPLSELYLRVAARLDSGGSSPDYSQEQTSLPLGVRDEQTEYIDAVPTARDETAFDLYKTARYLQSYKQITLLLVAQSLRGEQTPR